MPEAEHPEATPPAGEPAGGPVDEPAGGPVDKPADGSAGPSPDGPAEVPPRAHTLPEAREITRARVHDLRTLLGRYVRRHLPPPEPRAEPLWEPPRMTGTYAKLLPLLQSFAWLLALLFALSFVWDFPGMALRVFGYALPLEGLLRILSVSGLIGYLTNWLAITMLFRPRERRPLLGQGLVPAQRERIIYRLAKAVSEELINEQIIKQKIEESQVIPRYRALALTVTRGVLEDPDFRRDLKGLTAEYVEQVLSSEDVRKRIVDFTVEKIEQHMGQGLSGFAFRAYRLLNEADFQRRIDQAVRELPTSLDSALDGLDHLLDRVPEKIEARSEEIEQWVTRMVLGFVEKLDVYGMIVDNMRQYDEQQLERMLQNAANEQLNYIKYLGGVLGLIGGLVIWRPILSILIFGILGLTIYLADRALYRARDGRPPDSAGAA